MEQVLEEPLTDAYNRFTARMKARLEKKEKDGWSGWEDEGLRDEFHRRIMENAAKGQWVDVANLSMFLWVIDGMKGK